MDQSTTTAAAVSKYVKARLDAEGISEREAANRSGIPQTTLRRRLAGQPLTVDELDRLGGVLGTTAAELFNEATGSAA